MNGVYFYFVNKLFLVDRYWDFKYKRHYEKCNYRQTNVHLLNPFPNDNFLGSSKLKEFANDNFELYENGRQFFKRVENTMGKGEIAHYEQFLLFP